MNKLNSEYMGKYSEATFDAVVEVLKKCGVVKK